jgi:hypothetical protein
LTSPADQIPGPSNEERDRIRATLSQVGGGHWGFDNPEVLDVWLLEQRIKAERLASKRLTRNVGSGCSDARSCGRNGGSRYCDVPDVMARL